MMFLIRLTLSGLTLLSGAMLPMAAHAYLTPEDVLDEDQYTTRYYDPPPSKRAIDDYVQEQQDRSAARREAEQAAIMPQPEEEEEELHGSAPEEFSESDLERLIQAIEALQGDGSSMGTSTSQAPAASTNSTTANTADDLEERSASRALERLKDQQRKDQESAYAAWLAAQGYDETLHSGAPLSDTGSGIIAAAILMIGAALWTIRRVMKKEVVAG